MRIVIDMQGAQTESRFRGIGRYTTSFAQAIVRNKGEHEIILVLSGLFPETIEPIRATFNEALPQENILVWHAPGPVKEEDPSNKPRREVAELIREAFLQSLKPDLIHIPSLFEGYVDDAVTSIGRFDTSTPISATLYDLIPLLNPKQYLEPNPPYNEYYQRKIESLNKANVLLAISEYSKHEGIEHLAISQDKIISNTIAIESFFHLQALNEADKNIIEEKLGITKPFVLYTGGADERKNLPRLIQAYAGLTSNLRKEHQLVFAGKMPEGNIAQLQQQAKSAGLKKGELVFTGYVNDQELVQLYKLCELYVFPSWHEGFGLPALEAMACGAAVIGANTSSLPEVIGKEEALFDPLNITSITDKIQQALVDKSFCKQLKQHGLEQAKKFSWDKTAKQAISAWETTALNKNKSKKNNIHNFKNKPRLAYISPLPPEQSGISDYSAELLPELSKYYKIDIIVKQKVISNSWINKNCQIYSIEWFEKNHHLFERIIYQFGNSPFHDHMFDLLDKYPGVVVLHDFYLSAVIAYMDLHGGKTDFWEKSLYDSHGYQALQDKINASDISDIKYKYPCSLNVIKNSLGVIVHSQYSLELAKHWYNISAQNWSIIPLLRDSDVAFTKKQALDSLGFSAEDFIVCSFGAVDLTKLNHKLIKAWINSSLSDNKNCYLIFVGAIPDPEYDHVLNEIIQNCPYRKNIKVTGWADTNTFKRYLAAADIGVQLRTLSRGETSAAVLDCMNYSLPTIVNANGSMNYLNNDAVYKLPDNFKEHELTKALEYLYKNDSRRNSLGKKARRLIENNHKPSKCAQMYYDAIEKPYGLNSTGVNGLIQRIAASNLLSNETQTAELAQSIANSFPSPYPKKQLLIDVSDLVHGDRRTGIQRVVRGIFGQLLKSPPIGYRVEPVYCNPEQQYRYARNFMQKFLGLRFKGTDDVIDFASGDSLIVLDYEIYAHLSQEAYYKHLKNNGVSIFFVVHDLLLTSMPHCFPNSEQVKSVLEDWLKLIAQSSGAIGVSKSTSKALSDYFKYNDIKLSSEFQLGWFHLGADIENSLPSYGLSKNAHHVISTLKKNNNFLMVGTLEPRKGHAQVLDAFEKLWGLGHSPVLVIVGKQGWMVEELIERVRNHDELNKRLFWLEGISDEYLEQVYKNASCLIAASYGEGFGLPLIEAAQYKLPIIARDIPVFREVAGEHAYYFDGTTTEELTSKIQEWVDLYKEDKHPKSDNMPWLTWEESANNLLSLITEQTTL